MQIDWFTFVAQIINFAILLWLLNRFLYVPITAAIADRESAITNRIANADSRFEEARQLENELATRRSQIKAESESLREAGRESVEEERRQLLEDARNSVDQQRLAWIDELDREVQLANQSLKSDTVSAAVQVSRRVLSELTGADLNDRVIDKFVSRLGEIPIQTRDSIQQSLGDGAAIVFTAASQLHSRHRDRLEAALHETFGIKASVEYVEDADLIAGIRFAVGAHEVSWCASDYLEMLTEQFNRQSVAT